jgi:hypothetical protein
VICSSEGILIPLIWDQKMKNFKCSILNT